MKKWLLILLCLMLPVAAFAEGVEFAPDLTVEFSLSHTGTPEGEPIYIYRAVYPQLATGGENRSATAPDSSMASLFNNTYQSLVDDALGFECPMNATSLPADGPQMVVDIGYEITHLSDTHISVKVTKNVVYGEMVSVIITARTFPLTGQSAGLAASLPNLLGILDAGETDEWYLTRQIEKADKCVRGLVWEMLDGLDIPLYDDLTYEEFEANFYPEEDFYLNEAGDFVFFLQEGSVAEAEHGVMEFVISLETLLDEI